MQHYIIVKFQDGTDVSSLIPDIRAIFDKTRAIPGISGIELYPGINCGAGSNRYDLMIEMTMEKSALPIYNDCAAHKEWKEKYGPMMQKKCIFDRES